MLAHVVLASGLEAEADWELRDRSRWGDWAARKVPFAGRLKAVDLSCDLLPLGCRVAEFRCPVAGP